MFEFARDWFADRNAGSSEVQVTAAGDSTDAIERAASASRDRFRAELIAERTAIEARIAVLNDKALSIIQNMILILGSAILAAGQYLPAFAIGPTLWGAWMLYAQQTDRTTRKLTAYSTWLERQISQTDHDDTEWPSALRIRSAIPDDQTTASDKLLYGVPPAYAGLLQVAMIAIAIYFFVDGEHDWRATAAAWGWGVFMVAVLFATIFAAAQGSKASTEFAARLDSFSWEEDLRDDEVGGSGRDGRSASDP